MTYCLFVFQVEPSKQKSVEAKHIAGDLSSADENESENEEVFMEEEEEEEVEENDETNPKFDSDSDIEHVLDEEHIAAVEPKLNIEIPNSADGIMEEDGFDQKSTEIARSSAADVLESNEFCAKEVIEKEPMDFETCIIVNEISKYDQNEGKISEVVDIPCRENNGGSTRTVVVDQHMMDFEAEIAASQISKSKPMNGRTDYNIKISVEDPGILGEMKVASIIVPATSETLSGDGEQPHVDTESDETEVCQLSSAAGSVIIEDVATEKTEPHEGKVLKCTIRASSVECEAAPSDVITFNRNVQKRRSRADSVECENAESSETEACEIRVCRSSSKFIPVQHEDVQSIDTENCDEKVCKPTSTATSVQKEDIPSDESETCESRVFKSSCRAGSVQHVDVPAAETEICERRVHKPTRRARSVQPEDVPLDKTEICERKVHKPSGRASSFQPDDVPSDETEICEGKVHKPSRRAISVQPEDILLDETEVPKRKVHKTTRRASSLQPEDIPSDETEIHGRKVCRPSRRASSLQPEDIPSNETEICEIKVHKPTRRASSVQPEDIPSDKTEIHGRKVCRSSRRASSLQPEDGPSDETEIYGRKVHKPPRRASSVQPEDIPLDETEIHKRKVHKPTRRASSLQPVDVPSDETEICERKVCKPTIIAGSFQPENIPSDEAEICDRKVYRSSSRASSVGSENVPSDGTDICERKVHRLSSRATSVKLEDVQDKTEVRERKSHKSGSRASSIQHEVVSPGGTEASKRKVCKSRSRAGSVQHEDFLPDATEIQEGKVYRHSNRSSSVQHADVSSGVSEIHKRKVHKPSSRSNSVQDDDDVSDETVANERKDCKSSIRVGSPSDDMKFHDVRKYENINKVIFLQQEDIPADKTESGDRSSSKSSSRSLSVECKYVSSADLKLCDLNVCKPSSREGSTECEYYPVGDIDEHETVHKSSNRGGSVGQKVVFSETESAESRVHKSKCRASSVQKNHLEVIVEEEPCNAEGDKTGSSECRDIILSDGSVFNENRHPKASSVNSDASSVVVGEHSHSAVLTKKRGARSRHSSASSRCSSVQDDGTDDDVKIYSNKSHLPGSIQQNVFPDVLCERPEEKIGITTLQETEIGKTAVPEFGNITGVSAEKCHTHSSERVVDSFEAKIKKKCKQAESLCSFGATTRTTSAVKCSDVEDSDAGTEGCSVTKNVRESKDVTDKSQKSNADGYVYDTGSVELNVPPVNTTHDADIPMEADDKKEKTQQAISVFGLHNQGISSPSVLPHEMFTFVSDATGLPLRKARSESEYVVGAVKQGRRFTRSMLGISTSTTTDVGLVTDGNASAKKARRSDIGQERTGHSLEALDSTPGDGLCSEMSSGSSIKSKRKAFATNKGDSSSMQQVMEEYTTNRRLTRHQRSVMERSLELALQPDPQLR